MKKIITALVFMVVSFPVFAAGFIGLEYERFGNDRANTKHDNLFTFNPGFHVGKSTFDMKLEAAHNGSSSNTSTLEARAMHGYVVNINTQLFARVGLGETDDATGHYTFYTVEPIIKHSLNNKWSVNASVRHLNSVDSTPHVRSNSWIGGTEYKLTKEDTVGFQLRRQLGDSNGTGLVVNYVKLLD